MKENFIHFTPFVDNDLPVKIDFVGESYCDDTFFFSRENSNIMSLEYIISGEGVLEINGKEYEPCDDCVFFLAKGSNHKYYCTDDNAWHKIFVCFGGTLANALVDSYIPNDVYMFKNTNLKNVFENIYDIASNENYDYIERNDGIVFQLMKIFLTLSNTKSVKQLDLADIIKRTLDKNLQKHYTVADLSSELNYTKNHLINVFQNKYGETPYHYLCKKRIELAKEYLETTRLSVGEISDLLCYADSQYFSTSFKNAVGVSPSQYRKSKH